MRQRLMDVLKGALLFGLVGPPLGSLLYSFLLLGFGIMLSADGVIRLPGPLWMGMSDAIGKVAAHAFSSYLLGLVPAVLTGVLAGALRGRLSRLALAAVAALTGAVSSALAMAAWIGSMVPDVGVAWNAGLEMMPYGLFAGAVCGWLLAHRRSAAQGPARMA